MTACDLALELLRQFRLEGEEVVRMATSRLVPFKPNRRGYGTINVRLPSGRFVGIGYHRVKFCLAHGYLPEMVDHESRDKLDCGLTNLRPANRALNNHNTPVRRHSSVGIKGVGRNKGRFSARITVQGRTVHLGTYDTPEEAGEVYAREAARRYGAP